MCLFLFYRSLDTFWPTTGMFPQEFIISFTALMSIGNIKILSSNGKQTSFTGNNKSGSFHWLMRLHMLNIHLFGLYIHLPWSLCFVFFKDGSTSSKPEIPRLVFWMPRFWNSADIFIIIYRPHFDHSIYPSNGSCFHFEYGLVHALWPLLYNLYEVDDRLLSTSISWFSKVVQTLFEQHVINTVKNVTRGRSKTHEKVEKFKLHVAEYWGYWTYFGQVLCG